MNISIKKTLMVSAFSICLTTILGGGLESSYGNILLTIEGEPTVSAMKVEDKTYKTDVDIDASKEILRKVGELYIEDSVVNKDTILSIDIKANDKYEEYKNVISTSDSIEEIAEKIVDENNDEKYIDVNMKCKETRQETIEPSIKTVQKEDMYMGEILKEEGMSGYKEVVANVNYTNGIKTGEEIVQEKTIVNSKDTVVYKGVKDPIEDKVAFLEYPTEGGTITSLFGKRWGRMHNGMDIGNDTGDPVYSAIDGVVKECYYENGYGNKIVIEHDNNIMTVYAHLNEFKTTVGAEVKKGDLIGNVGNTGNSTGPHLHFEVRVNGVPINPQEYIQV
ncbi:peptidoglycan DD-metalloendopeptidase family protein [Clostridium vincentii]|uniref:Murein DD-endopeptidase MepM n=1 Tax=Clostridium vincentii TaxID=52704 RepID=A0A2T0BE68_9CLOT|nr:peptidoglycan DD-metalloendopeptidase family protein [Clostridium vincentii]PRR82190.1 Murein DD-endopeptidase MepM [Clostridium vincentii]